MELANYAGNYVETELSDSIVLVEDLTDSNGDKVDQLCDSTKLYHSCFVHRRDNQPEDEDDNGSGEAMKTRGIPDGKSDTDVDDEDIVRSRKRKVTFVKDDVQIECNDEGGDDDDEEDEDDEDEDEENDERETEEEEPGETEEDREQSERLIGAEDEEEEEEEHIEVRTPQWTQNHILTNSDTASADSNSISECETKSTSISFVDDSMLVSNSQPISGFVIASATTDYSDLEDKTDLSSFQELTNDNEKTSDEAENEEEKTDDILGGPNDNKGFDTVDNQLIACESQAQPDEPEICQSINNHQHRRISKVETEETIGLLDAEVENEETKVEGKRLIEITCNPLLYPENPLVDAGFDNDQVSLVTKHANYQRHVIKLSSGTSTSCSASSASTSSTSSRNMARRMVKSSGKAVKSISKKLTKLFK